LIALAWQWQVYNSVLASQAKLAKVFFTFSRRSQKSLVVFCYFVSIIHTPAENNKNEEPEPVMDRKRKAENRVSGSLK
jgi:hypothetical protein